MNGLPNCGDAMSPKSAKPGRDLELVPTAELVAELLTRCDHGIVSMLLVEVEPQERECYVGPQLRYRRWWKGNSATCMGLAHKAGNDAMKEWDEASGERGRGRR